MHCDFGPQNREECLWLYYAVNHGHRAPRYFLNLMQLKVTHKSIKTADSAVLRQYLADYGCLWLAEVPRTLEEIIRDGCGWELRLRGKYD